MKKLIVGITVAAGIVLGGMGFGAMIDMMTETSVAAEDYVPLPTPEGDSTKLFRIAPPEEEIEQILHEMTHQKVVASEKWGATQITQNRIDELIAIVEEGTYFHEDFYLDTLNAWKEGDFTNAVDVHNTIWEWQGGNVGRATGLLSNEDEEKFIRKHFED